jgi:uncharacterized membrane protein YbaN (DUF454 family)
MLAYTSAYTLAMYEKICKKIIFYIKNRIWHKFIIFAHKFQREMNYIFIALGSISLALGIAGIFLPVLPTTPFLLLAASLYLKGSRTLYDRLMAHEHLGTYIRNFQENKAIPLRVKITSVAMIWATLLYCAFFVARTWWMSLIFISIATGVTIHILRFKTLKK